MSDEWITLKSKRFGVVGIYVRDRREERTLTQPETLEEMYIKS